MKHRVRFLPFLLTLVLAATMLTSCSHEEIASEDLFFQALEQAASGRCKEAASSLVTCLERKDEWADVAADQLLDLLSDYPYLEVSQSVLKLAREYHPVQGSTLRARTDYPVSFSPLTLSGFTTRMLDDVASSWLTSDVDRRAAAELMAEAASIKQERPSAQDFAAERWSLYFYAGRLYEKNGSATYQDALVYYRKACYEAYSELSYDRPLWYFLELSRRINPQKTAGQLTQFSNTWHDPSYFEDFFDRLASDLLSRYDWNTFCRVYRDNEAYLCSASRAKYAVIIARLIECSLCLPEAAGLSSSPEEAVSALYQTALENTEYGSYYDLIARARTGLPFAPETPSVSPDPEDAEKAAFTEHLLGKLVDYDYETYAYRILRENTPLLSTGLISETYAYLLTKAGSESRYLPLTSLALKTARARPGDEAIMQLAFPPYYRTYIEAEARRYGVDPWLMFSLIHSESCFQADITSGAGAHGLTQLMDSTAGDVARKLKIKDYSLDDAATNIKFGSFYFGELIGRLDGDVLLAAFSYNAGITRVRNWRKKAPNLPLDIFLETLPFEETRLYGQKITRAAVMYAVLYYGMDYTQVLEYILHIKLKS